MGKRLWPQTTLVSLHKHSGYHPVPWEAAHPLILIFLLAALLFARVTTFVHAREDSSKGCLISVQGSPDPPVYYPTGVRVRWACCSPLLTRAQRGEGMECCAVALALKELARPKWTLHATDLGALCSRGVHTG